MADHHRLRMQTFVAFSEYMNFNIVQNFAIFAWYELELRFETKLIKVIDKVRIFWEGHKILRNIFLSFLCSASQKYF